MWVYKLSKTKNKEGLTIEGVIKKQKKNGLFKVYNENNKLFKQEYYKNDPLFADSKIVTSAFNYGTSGVLDKASLVEKIKFDQISDEKLTCFKNGKEECFVRIAIENSDAVIRGSDKLSEDISSLINNLDIPVLEYHPIEGFTEAYSDFYLNKVL